MIEQQLDEIVKEAKSKGNWRVLIEEPLLKSLMEKSLVDVNFLNKKTNGCGYGHSVFYSGVELLAKTKNEIYV